MPVIALVAFNPVVMPLPTAVALHTLYGGFLQCRSGISNFKKSSSSYERQSNYTFNLATLNLLPWDQYYVTHNPSLANHKL